MSLRGRCGRQQWLVQNQPVRGVVRCCRGAFLSFFWAEEERLFRMCSRFPSLCICFKNACLNVGPACFYPLANLMWDPRQLWFFGNVVAVLVSKIPYIPSVGVLRLVRFTSLFVDQSELPGYPNFPCTWRVTVPSSRLLHTLSGTFADVGLVGGTPLGRRIAAFDGFWT